MKRLHPHLLIILFVFSQLNPMDRQESIFSFQDIKSFVKENPVSAFIAAMIIPTFLLIYYKKYIQSTLHQEPKLDIGTQSLWLKTGDDKIIEIDEERIKKYPVLDYYMDRFGHSNSKSSPLSIGNEEGLTSLLSQDIGNFLDKMALFFPKKKDFDKDFDIVIPDELSPFEVDNLLPKEASINIAHFLQRLNPNPAFLLSRMVYHTQSPLVVRHENKY